MMETTKNVFVFQEEIEQHIIGKGLTNQERKVFWMMLEGKSLKEMSKEIIVTDSTINKHSTNVYAKLEVKGKTQLLSYVFAMIKEVVDQHKQTEQVERTEKVWMAEEIEARLLYRLQSMMAPSVPSATLPPVFSIPVYQEDVGMQPIAMFNDAGFSRYREREEAKYAFPLYH